MAISILLFSHSVMSISFATPWTVALQAPLSMEFPRQEYWSGLPFPSPGDLLDPGIEPTSPALKVNSSPLSHQGSMLLRKRKREGWREGGTKEGRKEVPHHVFREQQIRTAMRYHEWPKFRPLQTPKAVKDVEQQELSPVGWWECKMVLPPWKTSWLFLIKLHILLAYSPAIGVPGVYAKELNNYICTKSSHRCL